MRPVFAFAPLRGVVVAFAMLVTLLPGTIAPARAQGTIELPAIDVVSATLIPTPADQTASSVTVITAADIEREQRRTVPDVLQTVPGLNVVQSGGPGGTTAVFIRGMNANHVKVFIDGIDAGDPTTPNGAFDFAHLLTGDIEHIEVLRGPQSGLYGSDAMGGVISITTKRGEGPPKVTAMVEGGSFGTLNQSAGVRGSQGNIDYAFNVLHFRATNVPVTPFDLLPPGARRLNDTYNNWTYSGNVGVKLTDDLSVRLIGRYTQATRLFTGLDFVDFFPPLAEPAQSTQVNHNAYTRAEAVWAPSAGFKNVFGVSYVNLWNRNFDPNPDSGFTSPLVSPPITNLGQRTKFDWHGEAKVAPGQTVVLGLEHQRETLRTDSTGIVDFSSNSFTPTTTTAKTGNKAGFVELQSEFDKRFFVVSNIRYDDNENFGGHMTYRVAPAVLVPVTETKLKASYGTGFKAPTLNQLFVSFPSFLFFANPNLKPEKSVGYDAGFEQPFWNDRLRVGATYFNNNISDLIQSVTIDPITFATTLENVAKANTQGWEMFAAATVTTWLKVRTDYTFTRSIDESTGLDLLRRPRRKNSVTAIWTPVDKLSLSATLLHVGEWSDLDRQTSRTLLQGGYTVVNLAANYDVNEHLAVFGRVDNALNRQYEEPNGFLRPGLGVYGGVRVTN